MVDVEFGGVRGAVAVERRKPSAVREPRKAVVAFGSKYLATCVAAVAVSIDPGGELTPVVAALIGFRSDGKLADQTGHIAGRRRPQPRLALPL